MKVLRVLFAALVVCALAVLPAGAAEREKPNLRFFSGPQSHANWTPEDSSDANRQSIELHVGPTGYAGTELQHVEGQPAPEVEPSFYYKADRTGASGGSPRLQITFANGTVADLYPDEWETEWRKVGGEGEPQWDVRGVPCAFMYRTDYEQVKTCAANSPVVEAILVSDSWWLHGEYTNWVDQLQWNGFVFSHARDDNNSGVTPAAPAL